MKQINLVETRLVVKDSYKNISAVSNGNDAIKVIIDNFNDLDREYLFVINLSHANKPLNINIVSVGNINQSFAFPREVFKTSLLSNANKIILLHNHPSGSIDPSNEDIEVLGSLKNAGEVLGIQVLDSIVFNYNKIAYSLIAKQEINYLPTDKEFYIGELDREIQNNDFENELDITF